MFGSQLQSWGRNGAEFIQLFIKHCTLQKDALVTRCLVVISVTHIEQWPWCGLVSFQLGFWMWLCSFGRGREKKFDILAQSMLKAASSFKEEK